MNDSSIPNDVRFSLYLSTRYLQELELALRIIGVPCAYVRPGIGGFGLPRLYLGFIDDAPEALHETKDFISALPFKLRTQRLSWTDPDPEWWFVWSGNEPFPVCGIGGMNEAARIIVGQLYAETG